MSRKHTIGGIPATTEETAPTKERRAHNGGVILETIGTDPIGKTPVNRYRAVCECALDAYRHRKIITDPEHQAGLHFRQAYRRAVLSPGAARGRLNRYPSTERLTKSEKLIKDAYRTLSPHNMGAILDVCGHDQILHSPKSVVSLKQGLGYLSVQWHLVATEVCEHKKK